MTAAEPHSSRMWCVVLLLATVGSGLCVSEFEFVGNLAENYDNHIFQDQQEGDSPHPPSRWDKLFIALEESHMRQNMLLESAERCCEGGTLMGQVHALLKGTFQQHMHSLVRVCGAQAEQAGLRLQDGLVERERRINATLEVILQSRREENSELKRLQEAVTTLSAGCMRASGNKLLPSDLKQEMTPPEDVDKIKGSLVAIVTELQKVHLQLSNTMAQAGVRRGRET